MNSFGRKFRVSIFGESHGEMLGVVLDGVPAGLRLNGEDFSDDIARRKSGAKGTTPRKESDTPSIVSGVFEGHTTGAPLTIVFSNDNTRSGDYSNLLSHPRPSHADWVANEKFGGNQDYRGGGHFSGRLTLCLVAAGVVAKKILSGIKFNADILEIGGCADPARFNEIIEQAMSVGDSVGGVIECRVSGLSAGTGEPFFDSAESIISHALFSIPAVKGVEFGAGFFVAKMKGSECNDPIIDASGKTGTNNSGGINGGITNGNDIVFRVAVRPTPSISTPQQTFNRSSGKVEELVVKGRHDACIALRAPVVVEAATAIALADLILLK